MLVASRWSRCLLCRWPSTRWCNASCPVLTWCCHRARASVLTSKTAFGMGRPPVPLSQFVLKVHSRCDLACDHCYVYEAADQSWRRRPTVISDAVAIQAATRIAEHARAHSLSTLQVVLHGGEPLLAGRDRLERIITALRAATDGVCHLDLRIHTNG